MGMREHGWCRQLWIQNTFCFAKTSPFKWVGPHQPRKCAHWAPLKDDRCWTSSFLSFYAFLLSISNMCDTVFIFFFYFLLLMGIVNSRYSFLLHSLISTLFFLGIYFLDKKDSANHDLRTETTLVNNILSHSK